MKATFFSLGIIVLVFSFASCGYESPRYKALMAQADSIRSIQQTLEQDVEDFSRAFEYIDRSFDQIIHKEAARVQQIETNLNAEFNALVNNNIAKLNSVLQLNEEEVQKQKQEVQRNAVRVGELQRSIDEIMRQLEEEKAKLAEERVKTSALQTERTEQSNRINELNATLDELMLEWNYARAELIARAEVIARYEDELFFGYYITGTRAELIRKNVLTRNGLCRTNLFEEGANIADFTRVDIITTTEINLPSSVSGRILSAHPAGSYRIVQQGNNKAIQIVNPERFWSITKFLVVQ